MNTAELARRMAELGQNEQAARAYLLALSQPETIPEERLEAACFLLQSGEDYKLSYTALCQLHREGHFKAETLAILTDAFYVPNVKQLKKRYDSNIKLLKKYKYLFRKDFPAFDALPLRFYPYDDNGYLPYHVAEDRFEDYCNPRWEEITHYFFKDLENPILATDIFSQYELEYLRDNVRRSDWVGRENHIYLHYTGWEVFCAYLQILNLRPVLEEEKIVFLIGEEISRYPIDFKACFGIDYSQFPLKPVGIREVNKLIWHTQLAAHTGGDFFNEILHGHPNLLTHESWMMDETMATADQLLELAKQTKETGVNLFWQNELAADYDNAVLQDFMSLTQPTHKDALVYRFLGYTPASRFVDKASRIVPAILFQPHFENIYSDWQLRGQNCVELTNNAMEAVNESGLLRGFQYIKTFSPIRRPTTSYGATLSFMHFLAEKSAEMQEGKQLNLDQRIMSALKNDGTIDDELRNRLLNRSFMVDWQDRLFKDSRLVRFEDGKLNPTATFTALAEFLDIPYTESMTYCSDASGINPGAQSGNAVGFDPSRIYNRYEAYAGDEERILLEYLLRDVYQACGYGFENYDGAPLDEEKLRELTYHCETLDRFMFNSLRLYMLHNAPEALKKKVGSMEEFLPQLWQELQKNYCEKRYEVISLLHKNLQFINHNGQPLRLMTPLKLDPALLNAPLYH